MDDAMLQSLFAKGSKGKGKGSPAPPPPAKPKAPAADPKDGPTGEGKRVEVTIGPHEGKLGTVVKVTGEGNELRWRVEIDGGPTTWVDGAKPSDGAAPAASSEPASDPLGEGKTVEVVSGMHAGKTGLVLKRTGEGDESRWRVTIAGGGPTWVDKVKAAGGGGAVAHQEKPKDEAATEGKTIIEVAAGPHKGKRGTVLKVTGQGPEMRWRVQLDDGISTWVDDVNAVGGDGAAKSTPAASAPMSALPKGLAERLAGMGAGNLQRAVEAAQGGAADSGKGLTSGPIIEGRQVEITDGTYRGQRGKVLRVTEDGTEKRFRIQLDSGASTWTTSVAGVDASGKASVVYRLKWPVSGPGSDDGEGDTDSDMPDLIDPNANDDDACSEATDPEMPDLVTHLKQR